MYSLTYLCLLTNLLSLPRWAAREFCPVCFELWAVPTAASPAPEDMACCEGSNPSTNPSFNPHPHSNLNPIPNSNTHLTPNPSPGLLRGLPAMGARLL